MKFEPKGDKLDKYRRWILDGLDPADVEAKDPEGARVWARMRRAWALLSMGYGRNQVVAQLRNDDGDPVRESQAYAAARDALKLFGSLDDVDKQGLRVAAYEYYKLLAQLARKDGNHMAAIRAQENADKLYGLFEKDDHTIDPRQYELPALIQFTTDPRQLKAQQSPIGQRPEPEPETLDIDHEEAE